MKKTLLFFCFVLLIFLANAQPVTGSFGSPSTGTRIYNLLADSSFRLPRSTTYIPAGPGAIRYNSIDSSLEVFYGGSVWGKVKGAAVNLINNLSSNDASAALTAAQGKILKDLLDNNTAAITNKFDKTGGILSGASTVDIAFPGLATYSPLLLGVGSAGYHAGLMFKLGEGVDDVWPVLAGRYGSNVRPLLEVRPLDGLMNLLGTYYKQFITDRVLIVNPNGTVLSEAKDTLQNAPGDGVQVLVDNPARPKNHSFRSLDFTSSNNSINVNATQDADKITVDIQADVNNLIPDSNANARYSQIVYINDKQKVANKRMQKRIQSIATSSAPVLNVDSFNHFVLHNQSGAVAYPNPTGTPDDGDQIVLHIIATGSAAGITYGNKFVGMMPNTTTPGDIMSMGFQYVAAKDLWYFISYPKTVITNDQVNTYLPGSTQIFGGSATAAAIGFAGVSAVPSGAQTGQFWYRVDLGKLQYRHGALTHSIVTESGNDTFSNKDLTDVSNTMEYTVNGATNSATQTPTGDRRRNRLITNGLSVNATLAVPSGTYTDGNQIWVRFTAASGITVGLNAAYQLANGVTVPASLAAGERLTLNIMYDAYNSKWVVHYANTVPANQ